MLDPGGAGVAFDLRATWGAALSSSRIHELRQGGFFVQFYAKELNAEERAARAKVEKEAEEEASRRYEESIREAQQTCERCKGKRYACEEMRGRFSEAACRQEYLVRIERKGVSELDCE